MKRIFVVSWFYPPLNSSEALLTERLLAHSRYAFDVFTQGASEAWSYGREEAWPERPNVRRICGESADPAAWAAEAFAYFAAHRGDYALVMTRSMPPECHRVGLLIRARWPEIPWVASFGDPIFHNPYELLGGGLYDPYGLSNPLNRGRALSWRLSPGRALLSMAWRLRHRAARRRARELKALEDRVLARADRLLFNNASELRFMARGRALLARALVLRHSYDAALIPPAVEKGDRLRFVFTGQLNALRRALPLLRAIRRLKEARPDLPERAEFLFFGDLGDADLAYILRRGLEDCVHVHAPVPYRQSLAEAAGADWLLHIDANVRPVCEENPFFAGKLADYFGLGKPILAVTMPEGDAADTLRRAGALVLSFSVNEIKQALDRIVYGGLRLSMDAAFLRGFSAEAAAKLLDEQVVSPLLCSKNE